MLQTGVLSDFLDPLIDLWRNVRFVASSFAVHANVVEAFELLSRDVPEAAAFQMIPAGASAFGFVGALDPFHLLVFVFPTYAKTFFRVINFVFFVFKFRFLFFLLSQFCHFFHFFTLNVFKHDSFEAEGVEKGPFSKGFDLFGIDCSNDISSVSDLNDFVVFGYFWDFVMGWKNSLK